MFGVNWMGVDGWLNRLQTTLGGRDATRENFIFPINERILIPSICLEEHAETHTLAHFNKQDMGWRVSEIMVVMSETVCPTWFP